MKPEEKLTHAIISSYNASFWLDEVNRSGLAKHKQKNLLNRTVKSLVPMTEMYNTLEKEAENSLIPCFDVYFDFLKECSNVNIEESSEMTAIIKAYKKDRKSVLGIAKKVLS